VPQFRRAFAIDRVTFQTGLPGVFAAGNVIRPNNKLAVRSLADGKEAACSIDQYLRGQAVTGAAKPFNSRMDKLLEGETELFLAGAAKTARIAPSGGTSAGYSDAEARGEALRCLHCDCRKADNCKLRMGAQTLDADQRRFAAPRRAFEQDVSLPGVIYEPGKCIACGLCVQIAADEGEPMGLAFVGRGFGVRVRPPLGRPLAEGLTHSAERCVRACPTGALVTTKDTKSTKGTKKEEGSQKE
jgi:ferredoxin